MIEIAGLAVAGVAALGTIVQAYYSAKKADKKISNAKLRKAKERASSPLKTGIKKVAEVIDDDLLATLQDEIEKQNRNLIKAFQTPSVADSEREKMVESARLQICRFLSEVKRFNEDRLPTKRLEKLWSSNKCKT
jgi:CRISPR/Cas system CMR-associated protein Cmr1 (group 7 of RAMP superfamily)